MSKENKFVSANDFGKLPAKNFVLEKVEELPVTDIGQARMLFDIQTGQAYIFNGERWIACSGAPYKFNGAVTCDTLYNVDLSTTFKNLVNSKITKNSPIQAGTHTKVTYDENGLIMGGTNLKDTDIPDLSGTYIRVDLLGQANGVATLDANGNVVQNAGVPDASTTVKGIIMIASSGDIASGTSTNTVVTPKLAKDEIYTPLNNLITALATRVTDVETNKADKAPEIITLTTTSGSVSLSANKVYKVTPTGSLTFVLPTSVDNPVYNEIIVHLNLTSTYAITTGVLDNSHYLNSAINLSTAGHYDLIYEYDSNVGEWFVGTVKKGA